MDIAPRTVRIAVPAAPAAKRQHAAKTVLGTLLGSSLGLDLVDIFLPCLPTNIYLPD